jgi:hypothetical protein
MDEGELIKSYLRSDRNRLCLIRIFLQEIFVRVFTACLRSNNGGLIHGG